MTGTRFNLDVLDKALKSGALILVPNNRMRDAILYSLARREPASVFRTPNVQAVDIWVKELWEQLASQGISPCSELRVLSAAQEALVWTQLIEQSLDELPLLNPEETARAVSHAYQLMKQWQLDQPDQKTLQQFSGSSDVARFLQWSNAFKAWCEQQHSLPLVEAIRLLKDLIAAQQALQNRDIVLVNFLQPPPLYRALFAQLANVTEVTTARSATGTTDRLPVRRAFTDPASEIQACAAWAAALARQEPEAHIGIVCPDRKSRQEKFTRALADALHPESLFDFTSSDSLFNSAGASSTLLQTGLLFDAFLILGLVRNQQLSNELCRLLHSPYIVSEENGSARLQMELLMRRRFTRVCQQQEFSYYLGREDRDTHCPELARALVSFRTRLRAMPKRAGASAWADCFRDLLHCLGWPGPRTSLQELQLLRQWREALQSFAAMGELLGAMTVETAVARLRQLCQETPQYRQTGLRQAISFYSVTEAQGLQFDYLWLLGFDDQSWPPASSPSPFLPYALQLENDIPGSSSDIQFRLAQTDFTLLLASVKQDVVASIAQSDGEQQFRPSSFVLPFAPPDNEETNSDSGQGLNAYAMGTRRSAALQQRSDAAGLSALSSVVMAGGHRVISDQSACPFRAFVQHRLQIQALEDFPTGLTAQARGSVIHQALDHLYGEIDSLQALLALDQVQRRQHTERAAAQAVEELARRYPQLMTPRFRQIEQQRLSGLLEKFLALEADREPFEVVGREQRIPLQVDQLQLSLVVDRIDRLADQTLAIIDYKTGKSLSSRQSWLEERPEDMQLPVYMVAASSLQQGQVSVISLAQVNTEKLAYSALAAGNNFASTVKPVEKDRYVDQSWQELELLFRERVTRLAGEFQRGVSHVDPANGETTCQYCGLQSLCRIRDFRTQADSNGDAYDEDPA